MAKTSRNAPCPCGNMAKYKRCCLPKGIDFTKLSRDEWIRTLTVRGKNIYFINRIGAALQLDPNVPENLSFGELVATFKRAMTPKAVKEIYSAIPEIWPDDEDLYRCLSAQRQSKSGLYIGSFLFDLTARILNRHALYDEMILLVDPFVDPRRIAPEYNPLNKPEEHITTAFHFVITWLQLMPWIDKGIIGIIRDPSDFDYDLWKSAVKITEDRFNGSQELQKARMDSDMPSEIDDFMRDQFMLSHPDEHWFKKLSGKGLEENEIRRFLQKRRDESLYYVDVGGQTQLLQWSSGTNYELGKLICEITDSHLATDLSFRWKEMDVDRASNGVTGGAWTPFAKAFQNAELHYLNGVSFADLLKLREDGYLLDMRAFMRRLWTQCSTGEPFDDDNAEALSAELLEQVSRANEQWAEIDMNLLKWFGGETMLGAALGVATATTSWVPAVAVAGAGAMNLMVSQAKRKNFIGRFPAAFFIDDIRSKT